MVAIKFVKRKSLWQADIVETIYGEILKSNNTWASEWSTKDLLNKNPLVYKIVDEEKNLFLGFISEIETKVIIFIPKK